MQPHSNKQGWQFTFTVGTQVFEVTAGADVTAVTAVTTVTAVTIDSRNVRTLAGTAKRVADEVNVTAT